MKQTTTTSAPVSLSRVVLSFFYLWIFPLILFSLAGDLRWVEGWVFSAIFCLGSYATFVYLYFTDPELLKERLGSPVQKEQKPWDKVVLVLFFLNFFLWLALMPLDARRLGWSPPFPVWIKIAGTVLLLIALYILFAALRENTFATPVVKMQKERGQHVISTGPYRIVRHPMYSGATLLFVSTPLLLGSLLGLAMAMVLIVTIAVRSLGEEAMLKQELDGYREYMQRVKWRIVPAVF